jgi:hypothetical protein
MLLALLLLGVEKDANLRELLVLPVYFHPDRCDAF